jgi:hypothetical protein
MSWYDDDLAERSLTLRRVGEVKDLLVGVSRAVAKAARTRRSDEPLPGAQLVRDAALLLVRSGTDVELVARLKTRAATGPALTTQPGWAAELSLDGLPGFILSLQRQSAFAAVLARAPQVSLLGTGVVRVPVAGAAPPAKIISEGQPIPVIRGSFSPLALTAFKLAAISTFSDELTKVSNIEAVTRTLLAQSLSSGMDTAAFSATPPAGLLTGLTPVAASTSTDPQAALLADLAALVKALDAPSTDVVFAMPPSNYLVASALLPSGFGYALAATTALPTGTVVAVDPQGVAAALSAEPRLSLAEGSAVHEEDAPAPIVSGGVTASPVRSLFQTNMLGLRMIADTGWVARTGAVAFTTGVKW